MVRAMSRADVFVVSSDPLLRSALALALQTHDGAELSVFDVDRIPQSPGNGSSAVLVLDIDGVEQSPAEMTAAAVESGHRVLVLHGRPDVTTLVTCLEAGALGYQTKDLDLPGLAAAVVAVSTGEAVIPRHMLGGLLRDLIDRRRHDDEKVSKYNSLTRREREILALLSRGEDQDGIAKALVISPQTARTHIQNVLTKLDVHSRMEAVAFAHELGI